MTELEHDLADAANRITVDRGDLDRVMSVGRQRRARRQRAVSGVAVLAVVATIGAALQLDTDRPTPLATVPSMARGDAGLEWEVLSSTDGLGMNGSDVNGPGPFFALSTAPGQADVNKPRPSRVLWRSDDGVDWTATTTLGNDLYLSDLAPTDGRVYAVGTAPAQAGVKRRADLVAGWSDDGGKTFSKAVLPVDWAGIEAGARTTGLQNTQIATSEAGTVVAASIHAALDVPRLLPSGVTAPDGWSTTATGVDVLGPEKDTINCPPGTVSPIEAKERDGGARAPIRDGEDDLPKAREVGPGYCASEDERGPGVVVTPQEMRGVVRSFTWADLGVTGDLRRAASRELFAFFAPAGSTEFTAVELGDVRSDYAYLDAAEDGFHLLASGVSNGDGNVATTDLHSTDGRDWKATAGPDQMRWVSAAGTVRGHRMVIGENDLGTVVARSDGSGGWSVTPLSSVVDPVNSGGRPIRLSSAGIGPLGVVVAATVDPEKVDSGVGETLLVFSRDGATWEDSPVEKIAGKRVGTPLRIFVSGQRAVVSLSGGFAGEGQAPKPQTILVATPA